MRQPMEPCLSPVRIDDRLLLAALRDPALASSVFVLSLPTVPGEQAAMAFDGVAESLRRYARRPWRAGCDEAGCSAAETTLLRLFAALRTRDSSTAEAMLQWLLRPEGWGVMVQHATALIEAMAVSGVGGRDQGVSVYARSG